MVIGPNYVYIALPRTASQSMCQWLVEHHRGTLWNDLYHSAKIPRPFQDRFAFTIVRNPYSRMMSLYRLLKQKFWAEADEQVAETVGMSPAEFVRWCIGRSQPQWKSQAKVLDDCDGRPLHVLKFEYIPGVLCSLPFGGGEFPHIDATDRNEPMSSKFIEAVNEHSERDFERFGYPNENHRTDAAP